MSMDFFMLTLKTPSLHANNGECGTKEVNIKVSTDFNEYAYDILYLRRNVAKKIFLPTCNSIRDRFDG